jgi:hypothetical protein
MVTMQGTPEILVTQNSTYEIDHAGKRVRRLEGRFTPTPAFGEDEVWREYKDVLVLPNGVHIFLWDDRGKCTITSEPQANAGP